MNSNVLKFTDLNEVTNDIIRKSDYQQIIDYINDTFTDPNKVSKSDYNKIITAAQQNGCPIQLVGSTEKRKINRDELNFVISYLNTDYDFYDKTVVDYTNSTKIKVPGETVTPIPIKISEDSNTITYLFVYISVRIVFDSSNPPKYYRYDGRFGQKYYAYIDKVTGQVSFSSITSFTPNYPGDIPTVTISDYYGAYPSWVDNNYNQYVSSGIQTGIHGIYDNQENCYYICLDVYHDGNYIHSISRNLYKTQDFVNFQFVGTFSTRSAFEVDPKFNIGSIFLIKNINLSDFSNITKSVGSFDIVGKVSAFYNPKRMITNSTVQYTGSSLNNPQILINDDFISMIGNYNSTNYNRGYFLRSLSEPVIDFQKNNYFLYNDEYGVYKVNLSKNGVSVTENEDTNNNTYTINLSFQREKIFSYDSYSAVNRFFSFFDAKNKRHLAVFYKPELVQKNYDLLVFNTETGTLENIIHIYTNNGRPASPSTPMFYQNITYDRTVNILDFLVWVDYRIYDNNLRIYELYMKNICFVNTSTHDYWYENYFYLIVDFKYLYILPYKNMSRYNTDTRAYQIDSSEIPCLDLFSGYFHCGDRVIFTNGNYFNGFYRSGYPVGLRSVNDIILNLKYNPS